MENINSISIIVNTNSNNLYRKEARAYSIQKATVKLKTTVNLKTY